jgi:hypothetical protein
MHLAARKRINENAFAVAGAALGLPQIDAI